MPKHNRYGLPADYKLGSIADKVAHDFGLELQEDDEVVNMLIRLPNLPRNIIPFYMECKKLGAVKNPRALFGELEDKALLYYTGGITEAKKVCESLYVNNGKRVIGVTFGVPENRGSLLVLDIPGSIALQELSGVSIGQGGAVCLYSMLGLAKPAPLEGAAQFEDFSKVYGTIDTLLK